MSRSAPGWVRKVSSIINCDCPKVRCNRNLRRSSASIIMSSQLDRALNANLAVQMAIRHELERLQQAKERNRLHAAGLMRQWILQTKKIDDGSDGRENKINFYQPRKWSRRFFVDHKGSCPMENADSHRRRCLEEDASCFFAHLRPPWSRKETDLLLEEASNLLKHRNDKTDDFFVTLAESFSGKQFPPKARTRTRTILPRTAKECQIHYHENIHPIKQWNTHEIEQIQQLVNTATTDHRTADWEEISQTMKSTPWQCFLVYRSKTAAITQPWTLAEDQLLLKFLAAAGPQTVIDGRNPLVQQTLLTNLLQKNKQQLFTRANQSLVNPMLKNEPWSQDEERRLPILMKMYYKSDSSSSTVTATKNDLFLASTHYNHRGTKSVVDKWHRSINPQYSTKPFSKQEDEKLVQILRDAIARKCDDSSSGFVMGWTKLSQMHFPDRHPQRLMNRWAELASDTDILKREQALQMSQSSSPSFPKKRKSKNKDVTGTHATKKRSKSTNT